MLVIGVDAHTRKHSAAAVDEVGRIVELKTVRADVKELDCLVGWVQSFENDRLVAVEGAKGERLPVGCQNSAPTLRLHVGTSGSSPPGWSRWRIPVGFVVQPTGIILWLRALELQNKDQIRSLADV
jgi:hypothetical protein